MKKYCFLIFTSKKEFVLYKISLTLKKKGAYIISFYEWLCTFIQSEINLVLNQNDEKEIND